MNRIRPWLRQRNVHLTEYRREDEVDFTPTACSYTLSMNINPRSHSRLATALHECGHVLIFQQRRRFRDKTIAGLSYRAWSKAPCDINRRSVSRKYLKGAFEEERIAWLRGWALGRRLGIQLCSKHFLRIMKRSLKTYSRSWALPMPPEAQLMLVPRSKSEA